ncbi:hypothetical protein [Novipirellula artificiosorum]|uniref:Uncharacterized protein n=1 Tax=Novipirellula artificiosorum TaxID=2528016 RepID=A0A5C6DSV2_9BACT|nr:hypothetical protein [Novipirellula artificiosorum]TWU39375.1 hypothetical protein Poly41_21990 [Novipirellula artificiosorum]
MPREIWTKDKIIARLQKWHDEGVPVGKLWAQDSGVTSRSSAVFGSWRQALEAAGFASVRERWSRKRILCELKERHEGKIVDDSKLVCAAIRHFGSIRKALAAAGLPCKTKPPAHPDWTRQTAINAIRKYVEDGHNIRLTRRKDPELYAAAKRLFGNWRVARSAAGFPFQAKVTYSEAEVKRRIMRLHREGQSLSNMRDRDFDLHRSAYRWFGSWGEAVRSVGLEWTMHRRWSKRKVIEAIRKRNAQGHVLCRTWREEKSLFRAAVNWFGNWGTALEAAGFEPIHRERWTQQRVIERLKAWRERSTDTSLCESEPNLADAAIRFFGGLDKAFEEADIEPSPRYWTDVRVIAEIQERYVNGKPKHIQGLGDIRLANAAKRRFGSWAKAVKAAGLADRIPISKPLKRWTRQKVIEAIILARSEGIRLTGISKSDQSLYNAAKTHFGTWHAAMIAAGIPPSRRQWSKRVIIQEIQQRQRDGQSLVCRHPDNTNMAAAAQRHFGSWTAALSAAGIQTKQTTRKVAS